MKQEAKAKMISALDDVAKGMITLVVSAVVASVVENSYEKLIVSRRNTSTIEDLNA